MARLVLLVLLLVPLVEVALFILLGGLLGLWPTLGLAVATALAGAALIRRQGFAILARAQAELASRRLPVAELFDALCLFLAGALLLTPGFATDFARRGCCSCPPCGRRCARCCCGSFCRTGAGRPTASMAARRSSRESTAIAAATARPSAGPGRRPPGAHLSTARKPC